MNTANHKGQNLFTSLTFQLATKIWAGRMIDSYTVLHTRGKREEDVLNRTTVQYMVKKQGFSIQF